MQRMITNCYDPTAVRPKLNVEFVSLYSPVLESEWTFSHHPHIAFFQKKLYAIWSNGRMNEDDMGQRVLISVSGDFYNWSAPVPLVDSLMGKHSELVLTAAGFHCFNDERLVAYFGQYEYKPEYLEKGERKPVDEGHMETCLRAVTSSDGKVWSTPLDLHVPIVPNHGPAALSSGRLIISGNTMFPYTDDPSGLAGWKKTGIYPESMADEIYDDSESFRKVKERMAWAAGLCEGSFYEMGDGTVRMLLRSNTERLWVTESRDGGETWTSPEVTGFTDNCTKFHFGRLPDGRYYYVGCPDPVPIGRRNPLVLSLSADGNMFDRHYILGDESFGQKFPGLHKGGDYGYPHSLIHDGYLYIIFSIQKERVAVIRTAIEGL
ncbi:exo-alpha-sialidase [Paenibacillus sp. GCM10027626]|uniref:exo-alpha-sialidase n=1 Tax=Paenibacillus sp. GCM10027626 TaxID=3273411 RepID=UPI00362AB256